MLQPPRLYLILDTVARAGSIRKAAERLRIASTALNRTILNVEKDLGTPLFERLARGVRLTAAGEVLIANLGFPALFLTAAAFGLASCVLALLVPPREAGRERPPVRPPASGGRTLLSSLLPVLAATILFSLARSGPVELAIFSVDGRRVRRLLSEPREAGEYRVLWDGRDDDRHAVASGVYYAWLMVAGQRFTARLVCVR